MEMVVAEDDLRAELLSLKHGLPPHLIAGYAPLPELHTNAQGLR
jgi:hypothetical protein